MARWNSANVLNITPDSTRLWQYSASGGKFSLERERTVAGIEKLPDKVIQKDWHTIWQPKLNIAWLPMDKVFFRALQLPSSDSAELLSMVELQLEKISPLPVAQIVWSVETLPKRGNDLQTVIVIIVARNLVEDFLGKLEGRGCFVDRLELPTLDQLLATSFKEDGVWLFPESGNTCLVAWSYGGALQNVTLLSVPPSAEAGAQIKEQLSQMAWSGEIEGWLTSPPRCHLVADEETAAIWEPMLAGVGETVQVEKPMAMTQLATLSANRAGSNESGSNLLPPEYSTRYQQQFVDRLWMRGLGALLMVYMIGVVLYFGALQVLKFQKFREEKKFSDISQSYTNTLQLKEQIRILEEQGKLKYAALDCWKATAESLPQELTLTSLSFSQGKELKMTGTVPQENLSKLTDFAEALGKVPVNGGLLTVSPPVNSGARPNAGGISIATWNLSCTIPTKEGQ